MNLTISYNVINYDKTHIISKLSNLIINNLKLLKVISNIYLIMNAKKINDKCNEYQELLKRQIRMSIMSGYINEDIAKDFIELWNNISNEHLGIVLEQLISNLGPYKKETLLSFDKSMEVNIIEIQMENNFDVVFFDEKFSNKFKYGNEIKICDFVEFHECKKNVCTYIPKDAKKPLKSSVEKKLNFMKATYDLNPTNKFYIPTLYPLVDAQREFLEKFNNGQFAFIEILSINDLYNSYACC